MLIEDWEACKPCPVIEDAIDLYTQAAPKALMRSRVFKESGIFRISRRDCELYSVEIKTCGAWGRLLILDGNSDWVFYQPSAFTGSFVLGACCFGGMYLWAVSGPGADSLLTINWREQDRKLV